MISIVLYGRNDSYGYNLHKRAALSLNCMAEVLTDPSDEILFVDYNTPDDFPTFPEAIQDTLTKHTKQMLRIFRVRPRIHERFKSKTHLLALEPIARNVAVRRSSESNRWILSTNTDMIFVPLHERSLSGLARGLEPGFYHAPRIEIPEVLWESLNRRDPVEVIKTVRSWGSSLHLNEIVLGSKIILYDGPGDFQLLLRSDLFENQGFDEEMLLGWHVDSNIAARMCLKYGKVGDLGSQIYGYHCDHTRQVTPAHSHTRQQNDWRRFVSDVARSDLPAQANHWGCSEDDIDEVRLPSRPSGAYVRALRGVIGERLSTPNVIKYVSEAFNKVDYDPRHVLPFLIDIFMPMPRETRVAWYGTESNTLRLFGDAWLNLGFTGAIMVDRSELLSDPAIPAISEVSASRALAEADTFIFDFGGLPPPLDQLKTTQSSIAELHKSFRRVIRAERLKLSSGAAPRRIIALNAIGNEYERFVCGSVAAAATPFSTHMRHGFVSASAKEDWLSLLALGEAGIRAGTHIKSDATKRGWIAFGPYHYLDEGSYSASINIELLSDEEKRSGVEPCVCIEFRAGSRTLALRLLRRKDLARAEHRFEFAVSYDPTDGVVGVEIRIALLTPIALAVQSLTVEPSTPAKIDVDAPDILRIDDWLPYLRIGSLGRFTERGVIACVGRPDFVVYGPYWSLPTGSYEIEARIECDIDKLSTEHLIRADVAISNIPLVVGTFQLCALSHDTKHAVKIIRLRFTLDDPQFEGRQIETRIWSSGEEQFILRSLSVKVTARRNSEDLLPLLLMGAAGRRVSGTIQNQDCREGPVAYSPTIALEPGTYKISYQIIVTSNPDTQNHDYRPFAIMLVKQGNYIISADPLTSSPGHDEHESIVFAIQPRSDQLVPVYFSLQVMKRAHVQLKHFTIERTSLTAPPNALAALRINNWLPFLPTQSGIGMTQDGLLVGEEKSGFLIWGPYWTLPAGGYEVIAVIALQASNVDGKPIITLDVSSDGGQRLIAEHDWHLGRILPGQSRTELKCRLPFVLGDDLSAQMRTIETRLSASGGGSFQLRSLHVQLLAQEAEKDALPYLSAGECGVYVGNAIESLSNRTGCIACTPTLYVEAGCYEAYLGLANGSTEKSTDDREVTLQIQSGPHVLATRTYTFEPASNIRNRLTFNVGCDLIPVAPIELTILTASQAPVLITALRLVKLSNDLTSQELSQPGTVWIERFRLGSVGRAKRNGVVVRAGIAGLVGYMFEPFRAGRYEIVLRCKRVDHKGQARGRLIVSVGSVVLASETFEFRAWNRGWAHRFRVCAFDAPVELARDTGVIQIRVDSVGSAPFLIKSIELVPRKRFGDRRRSAFVTGRKVINRLRILFSQSHNN